MRRGPTKLRRAARALGALHGLPVAHKDLVDTAGIRTTRGSPFYRDNVPTHDALIVTRIRAAGAVTRRQDQHTGVRRRIADVQHRLRRDAQSVRSRQDVRRQQRRRGGGARVRDGADCRRQRHRRIAAQPRRVLQRRRLAAVARPRAERIDGSWSPLSVSGPDGAHRSRTWRCSSARSPARTRGARSRSARTRRGFAQPLDRAFKGVRVAWWRGLGGIPFEPEVRRVVDGESRASSRTSAASSRRPSRTSPASTRRFRSCGTPSNHAQYAPLVARAGRTG